MNTNLRKTIGQIVFFIAVTLALTALTPCAHAQGGIPLWTNGYGLGIGGFNPFGIIVDSHGDIIVTGQSPVGFSADYATIKYSSAGVPLWTNRFNGTENLNDTPYAIAVDTNDNVFVTGGSMTTNVYPYGFDCVTIKYSSAGLPLWTNRYNGLANGNDGGRALAVDNAGNVFVAGNSFETTSGQDYLTIKYSNAGVALWTYRYNGPANGDDIATGVAVDSAGHVFVSGGSGTIAYSSTGVPLWTNYSTATLMAVDQIGNVLVAGTSTGDSSDYDFLTVKYSNAGVALWTNRYNGPENGSDYASGLVTDANGNVFVTGSSYGTNGPSDYATIKYSSAGVPLWTNRYSGGQASGITADNSGNVFVTGYPVTIAYSSTGALLWTNSFGGLIAADRAGNVIVQSGYRTIKYSPTVVPIHLALDRDGSGGLFIRYAGAPDVTYRLQRAASVTGTWTNLATNTAPASGLIEYHDTSPLPGQAFYRAVQP